jgi:pimeloyl-ACP methyl ester carboxylesterase
MATSCRATEVVDLRLPCGRRIRVRRRPGRGATIVLLHGMLDSSEGWGGIAQATERPTVAFDLPGFGGSDLPTRPRLSAFAEDIATAMCQMDLRDVTLVGHSLGGAVATAVAKLVSDRLASLVLLAPAGFGRIALAETLSVPGIRALAAAGRSKQGFHSRCVNFHGPVAALWGQADRVVPAAHTTGLERAFPQRMAGHGTPSAARADS